MKALALAVAMIAASSSALAAESKPAPSETVAIAHLMAANDHEIKAADLAAEKGVSPPVADYAALMRKEHGENQAKASKLPTAPDASAPDAAAVAAQKQKEAGERNALAALSGTAFEKAYVDAMVQGHSEVLVMLDTQLIPAATTPSVKQHLTETREHVAMHLDRAKALQTN